MTFLGIGPTSWCSDSHSTRWVRRPHRPELRGEFPHFTGKDKNLCGLKGKRLLPKTSREGPKLSNWDDVAFPGPLASGSFPTCASITFHLFLHKCVPVTLGLGLPQERTVLSLHPQEMMVLNPRERLCDRARQTHTKPCGQGEVPTSRLAQDWCFQTKHPLWPLNYAA